MGPKKEKKVKKGKDKKGAGGVASCDGEGSNQEVEMLSAWC
jgi:hypothetical protein